MSRIKIQWAKPSLGKKEKEYLLDALGSGWVSDGAYVDRFRKTFLRKIGGKYGLTVSSGTAAVHLALLSIDTGPRDEVIVPGFSFATAANMVIACGARPVYAEINPETWCIDAGSVKKLITKRTKAIIAVHTYGNVCDMGALQNISKKHNLYLIEDAAEAAFSKYKERYAGTFGDIGAFSFQATKTLAMGEGGFITTTDERLCDKMQYIRDHGMSRTKKYWHRLLGFNFRLTNLQAAVGCAQLENIDDIITARKRVYNAYLSRLQNMPSIIMQEFSSSVKPIVWTVAIRIKPNHFRMSRDCITKKLLSYGIETRPGFYPFSSMPIYNAPPLKVSEEVARTVICLPTFCELTEKEISYICDRLKGLAG